MTRLALIAVLLAGCGTSVREPRVELREVKVPVPIPCPVQAGPATVYPDSDEALRAAPDLFTRVQLLLAGRRLRIEDLAASRRLLTICGASAPATAVAPP